MAGRMAEYCVSGVGQCLRVWSFARYGLALGVLNIVTSHRRGTRYSRGHCLRQRRTVKRSNFASGKIVNDIDIGPPSCRNLGLKELLFVSAGAFSAH